jgi:protein involved in polysaccharide export with SLBB domain
MRYLTFILSLLLFLFWQTIHSQNSTYSRFGSSLNNEDSSKFHNFGKNASIALDQKIDSEKYIIGSGDILLLNIIGGVSITEKVMVLPEGSVLIPNFGLVDVAGHTLSNVKIKLTKAIRNNLVSKGDIYITLFQPRSIKVIVTSEFGTNEIIVSSINRVSEVVPNPNDEIGKNLSKRNIKLFRNNGNHIDTLKIDLLTFYRLGKKEPYNPYLQEGDVVFIPPKDKIIDMIHVLGAVKSPLSFEYLEGDNLSKAIEFCFGFTTDAKKEDIEIIRFVDQRNVKKLTVNYNRETKLQLQADDRIFVPRIPKYHDKHNVSITGEVKYPGTYAIIEDSTTLREIIERAGGLSSESDLINAKLIRYQGEDRVDHEYERIRTMISVGSDLTEEEEEYYKLRTRQEPGIVSTDFYGLFVEQGKKQNILLKNFDKIYIPKKSNTITIIGAVVKPGILEYVPGKNYLFYIEKSLGFSNKARSGKTQIIKGVSGQWLDADTDIVIEIGDKIFVPEEPVRDYWEITKDIIAVVSQAAAIFAIIWTVSR